MLLRLSTINALFLGASCQVLLDSLLPICRNNSSLVKAEVAACASFTAAALMGGYGADDATVEAGLWCWEVGSLLCLVEPLRELCSCCKQSKATEGTSNTATAHVDMLDIEQASIDG